MTDVVFPAAGEFILPLDNPCFAAGRLSRTSPILSVPFFALLVSDVSEAKRVDEMSTTALCHSLYDMPRQFLIVENDDSNNPVNERRFVMIRTISVGK